MGFLKPRLALLSDLRARSGVRVAFLPPDDVVSFETPDAVDLTGTGTLVLRGGAPALALLRARMVVEIDDWASTGVVAHTEEWRVLVRATEGGGGAAGCTLTLVSPLLDWGDAGRIAVPVVGGVPTYAIGGYYAPADLLQLALDRLALVGQGHWGAGTIDRADVQRVDVDKATPLELLNKIRDLWALEIVPRRVNATTWVVDLVTKRNATAKVPTLRATRALRRISWTQDAAGLASAVLAEGAGGGTIAHAADRVTSAETVTDWVELVDPGGGAGCVQIDGQYVGNYLERADGSLVAIVDSQRNDGVTSRLRLGDASGVAVGDELELRVDGSGTRLVELLDPAIGTGTAADFGYRQVPFARTDLPVTRNYIGNPRGAAFGLGATEPDGWTRSFVPGGNSAGAPVMSRQPTPAGSLIDDDGTGEVWTIAFNDVDQYVRLPATNFLGGADVTFLASVWLAVIAAVTPSPTRAAPGVRVRLVTAAQAPIFSPALAFVDLTVDTPWVRWNLPSVFLALGTPLVIELVGLNFGIWTVPAQSYLAIAGGQIGRGATPDTFTEVPRANVLRQASNAYLLQHRAPTDAFECTADDFALVDADLADVPLRTGGDVRLLYPEIGLDRRARVVSLRRNRLAPDPPSLVLVAAPDPVAAALDASAAPSRPRDLIDILLDGLA